MLFVDDTVIQLSQFCFVPTLGSTHEVTSDTLKFIDAVATTLGAHVQLLLCILVAAIHTTVAVVVHRALTDIVLIHQIDDIHNRLRVVRSIAINLNIEDVTTTSQVVIRSLNLSLVLGRALVIYGNVV